jgi:hypothetical protein
MKKALIILLLAGLLNFTLKAQDYKTSLGLRAGYPYGLTIKHFVSEANAFEGILAANWGGFVAIALYENEHWTGHYPGFNWFWGLGAHIGSWDNNPHVRSTYTGSIFGVDGIVGLEYTFDEIPLNLSLDLLPSVNLIGDTNWGGIFSALSIRYVF